MCVCVAFLWVEGTKAQLKYQEDLYTRKRKRKRKKQQYTFLRFSLLAPEISVKWFCTWTF